jgi:hypothetical protein
VSTKERIFDCFSFLFLFYRCTMSALDPLLNRIKNLKVNWAFRLNSMSVAYIERLDIFQTSLSKKIDLQRDFAAGVFYPSEAPFPPMTPYSLPPFPHCIRVYSILIPTGRGGGANQREGYMGKSSQSRSKIPTCLTLSPVCKLY